jgi:hypothetical protein
MYYTDLILFVLVAFGGMLALSHAQLACLWFWFFKQQNCIFSAYPYKPPYIARRRAEKIFRGSFCFNATQNQSTTKLRLLAPLVDVL